MARRWMDIPVFLLAAGAGGLVRADRIELSAGRVLEKDVEITSAAWDRVEYTQAGVRNTLTGDQVLSLGRDSPVLARSRRFIQEGDYPAAVKDLRSPRGREWEQAEMGFLLGKALLLSGSPAEARAAFEAYLKKYGEQKDWWVPEATYQLGLCQLALGDASGALESFKAVEGFGGPWRLRSLLGSARAQLAAKKYLEARGLFDQVASERTAPVALRQEALVGRAEVFLAQEQYPQALRQLDDGFFRDPPPGELLYSEARGRATVLKGLAYKLQGNLELAEIWFLRAALLFAKHGEVYRRASAELAEVYAKMGKPERAEEWRRRGSALAQNVGSASGPQGGNGSPARRGAERSRPSRKRRQ